MDVWNLLVMPNDQPNNQVSVGYRLKHSQSAPTLPPGNLTLGTNASGQPAPKPQLVNCLNNPADSKRISMEYPCFFPKLAS